MKAYVCDWCGRLKNRGEQWILGFAAERYLSTGCQREFSVAAKWSDKSATNYLAVHLCCEEHKNEYVRALFETPMPSAKPAAHSKVQRHAAAKSRSSSAAGVSASLGVGSLSPGTKTRSKSKTTATTDRRARTEAQAPASASLQPSDEIRAHGMSIRLPAEDYTSET